MTDIEEAKQLAALAGAKLPAQISGYALPSIAHSLIALVEQLTDDDPLNAEEEHQSQKFETTPLAGDGEDLDDTVPRPAYTIDGEDDEHDPRHQRPVT